MNDADREAVKKALYELSERNNGRLTAEMVVDDAKDNPESPFYKYFEWDESEAARAHWIDRARDLIRTVRIEVVSKTLTYQVPAYVRDPEAEPSAQGYVAVQTLKREPANAVATITHEYAQADGYLARAERLAAFLQVEEPHHKVRVALQEAMAAAKDSRATET